MGGYGSLDGGPAMSRLLALMFALLLAVGGLAAAAYAEEPIAPAAAAVGGAIEGTVTDEVTGSPVEGVGVMAYWYCPTRGALIPVSVFLKMTNADGRYRLGGLDDNTYYVAFHGEYAGYESEWYDNWREFDDITLYMMTSIDIVGGAIVPGIDAALTPVSPTPPPPASGTFYDDDGSVFEDDIEWLAAEGITRGCNPPINDRFCPDSSVTRGQMAAFLTRALELPSAPTAGFVDTVGSTFENDIDRLAAAGITRGCNPPANDRFCPDDPVRREVMAAFLVRALGYTDDGGGDLFTDDDDSIFEPDIDKLATAGVTRGCNPPVNDRFCPRSNVTRGQMAAFLHRALG